MTCTSQRVLEEFIQGLIEEFKTVTIHRGVIHNYLSMNFNFQTRGEVQIVMPNYIQDVLSFCEIDKSSVKTPALDSLFVVPNDDVPLNREEAEYFHSVVAKLLFLAKRTRPDILLPVNFLSTRVSAPCASDSVKLDRVLRYLKGTVELGIVLRVGDLMSVEASIDASYGVHADGKSHSGLVISVGKGPIFVKSSKQKIVTKSSYEAELVALSDNASQVIWSRQFLIGQGFIFPLTKIYQDNKATISSIVKGTVGSERSRHIDIRRFWLTERIESGDVNVEYCCTDEMVSDLLTKPLQGDKFIYLRSKLLNWFV
jgi:hypothetical protein